LFGANSLKQEACLKKQAEAVQKRVKALKWAETKKLAVILTASLHKFYFTNMPGVSV
jgi:hypothetical protein